MNSYSEHEKFRITATEHIVILSLIEGLEKAKRKVVTIDELRELLMRLQSKNNNYQIPELTLSGGKISKHSKKILEYRVWCHHLEGGNDDYYVFDNYDTALKFSRLNNKKKLKEKPLGVIWDKKFKNYREVVLV